MKQQINGNRIKGRNALCSSRDGKKTMSGRGVRRKKWKRARVKNQKNEQLRIPRAN